MLTIEYGACNIGTDLHMILAYRLLVVHRIECRYLKYKNGFYIKDLRNLPHPIFRDVAILLLNNIEAGHNTRTRRCIPLPDILYLINRRIRKHRLPQISNFKFLTSNVSRLTSHFLRLTSHPTYQLP